MAHTFRTNILALSGESILNDSNNGLIINNKNLTGTLSNAFYPLSSNPSGYVFSSQTGNLISNGQTGNFISFGITGNLFSSFVNINQTGQFVDSSKTGNFVNNAQSGLLVNAFYPLNSNPAGYVTSSAGGGSIIQVTGSSALTTGNLTGIGGTIVKLSGNYILISGGNTGGNSSSLSGSYIFNTIPTSGLSLQFISFPTNLGNNPYVISSLNNASGTEGITVQASGITSSGYWANYSNTIDSSGYILTTIASLSSNTGLAVTVLNTNINYSITGVSGSGNTNYIPVFYSNGNAITSSSLTTNSATTNLFEGSGSINNYLEFNNQNLNNGWNASSDIIATADIGSSTTWYVDLGINSSQYTGQYVGGSGDSYVYSSGNNMYVGTVTPTSNLYLFAGNNAYPSTVSQITINSTGTNLTPVLSVSGSIYSAGNKVVTSNQTGVFLNTSSIITSTGIISQSTGSNEFILSTYFNQQFNTGLQSNVILSSANTQFNILSGNIGKGTWMVFSSSQFEVGNKIADITTTLWSGVGAFFSQTNQISSGSNTVSGYGTTSLNGIITNPFSSMPLVLSCASSIVSPIVLTGAPLNVTVGATAGCGTYINAVRLY